HTSRAPELDTPLPPRPHTYNPPPVLHSSTPTRLQRASRVPFPPYLRARSAPPELPSSTSARLQRDSRAPCLHVCTSAAYLHASILPHRYAISAPPDLHASTSLHM